MQISIKQYDTNLWIETRNYYKMQIIINRKILYHENFIEFLFIIINSFAISMIALPLQSFTQ